MTQLHIRIVMATCNGAAHLSAQLDSFAAQTHDDWALMVADDGSGDATPELLAGWGRANPGRLAWSGPGPGRGVAANFLTLLARAAQDAPQAALAFSDQDDVWLPQKLACARDWLLANGADRGVPLIWTCRTVLTDHALAPLGESRQFPQPPGFGNALVQNILAGNTMVLSPAAARAVAATVDSALATGVPYHDWWVYQVLTGIGAGVRCEPAPLVLYRQHDSNMLGHHGPVRGRLRRLGLVARRDYSAWIDANLAALRRHETMLTPPARLMLRAFMQARRRGGPALAAALPRLGLHRQTPQGDRMLRLMALSGRL